jgi:hypothetical protein
MQISASLLYLEVNAILHIVSNLLCLPNNLISYFLSLPNQRSGFKLVTKILFTQFASQKGRIMDFVRLEFGPTSIYIVIGKTISKKVAISPFLVPKPDYFFLPTDISAPES